MPGENETKEQKLKRLAFEALKALESEQPDAQYFRFKDIVERVSAQGDLGITKDSLYTQLNTLINRDERIIKVGTGRFSTKTAAQPSKSTVPETKSEPAKPAKLRETELDRLRRENQELRQLISELTLRLHKSGNF